MSLIKNIILNLPVVKKELTRLETFHRSQVEQAHAQGSQRVTEVQASLTKEKEQIHGQLSKEKFELEQKFENEDVIMNKYRAIKNKNIILDTKVVHVIKGKTKYNLILVRTKHGDFRINVGRHGESGIGLGEHEPHHEPVKL